MPEKCIDLCDSYADMSGYTPPASWTKMSLYGGMLIAAAPHFEGALAKTTFGTATESTFFCLATSELQVYRDSVAQNDASASVDLPKK